MTALYAVSVKDRPTHIRIVEVYANRHSYDTHLKSPHFITYKAATDGMVLSLDLVDTDPITLRSKTLADPG